MKKILTFCLFFIAFSSFSQDQLFKKDNTKLEVKILEINQNEIKYKLFNYLEGPTIIISKNDVALIIYQNGTHEAIITKVEPIIIYDNPKANATVSSEVKQNAKLEDFKKLTFTKNLVSINIMEPLNGTFSISYLREFARNNANIYIPVSVGFSDPYMNQSFLNTFYNQNRNNISDYKYTNKNFEIGLGVHFQTSGKRAVTHFIGPYVAITQYTGTYIENVYTTNPNYYVPVEKIEHSFVLNRTYIMLNNGFLFRATKNFNIILNAAFGVKQDNYQSNNPVNYYSNNYYYSYSSFPITAFKFGLSFGYRF